ncbi:MAG: (d)CMP kinase [Terriglobia bacterium]
MTLISKDYLHLRSVPQKMNLVIAIDGPAGAGKSTVAQKLAARLGLAYVDSGATYRAAALKVLEDGVSPDDKAAVVSIVAAADIRLQPRDTGLAVLLGGRDVTAEIRTPEVTLAAAKVSRLPEVRSKLIALQRDCARERGVVMEGRDIGTVVFPSAPLKIFLTARPEERARRRQCDERVKGRDATLEQTAEEIGRRDQLDVERKISPLVAAEDACTLDSTGVPADEIVDRIISIAAEKQLIAGPP